MCSVLPNPWDVLLLRVKLARLSTLFCNLQPKGDAVVVRNRIEVSGLWASGHYICEP